MPKEFVSIENIEIGSLWYAADGGSYGIKVVNKDIKRGDLIVVWFDIIDGVIKYWEGTHDVDWFKLQYRYKQGCINDVPAG
jgi:hypothetical protein